MTCNIHLERKTSTLFFSLYIRIRQLSSYIFSSLGTTLPHFTLPLTCLQARAFSIVLLVGEEKRSSLQRLALMEYFMPEF